MMVGTEIFSDHYQIDGTKFLSLALIFRLVILADH